MIQSVTCVRVLPSVHFLRLFSIRCPLFACLRHRFFVSRVRGCRRPSLCSALSPVLFRSIRQFVHLFTRVSMACVGEKRGEKQSGANTYPAADADNTQTRSLSQRDTLASAFAGDEAVMKGLTERERQIEKTNHEAWSNREHE